VRDFEAGVDRSFLYCERLVAGRRRVEPDVEDGLVEAGVDDGASACEVPGEVRWGDCPWGVPAVLAELLALEAAAWVSSPSDPGVTSCALT